MVTPAGREPGRRGEPGPGDSGQGSENAGEGADRPPGERADRVPGDGGGEPADRPPGERAGPPPDAGAGDLIVRLDVWATGVFAAVSVAAAALPDALQYVSVPLHLVLFALGCGAFLWAYAVAVGRSRYETLTMGGVFFLGDQVAPDRVRRTLRLALAVQVVVAVAVAAIRPFTVLAFAVLVPMLGLGLMALWGARHGRFPAKAAVPADRAG